MKTFSHILRYILVAAALASCQRTDDSVAEPVVSESFTATIESFEDQTRTALDGKYAVWTSGDEIAVFQGRSTADRYVLYDLKASSFRLADRAEDGGDAFEANVALYPYSESLTCEKTDAGYKIDNISFPSVQQYKENSFSEESFFMAALTAGLEDRVLDFRNICGGLRLYITGEKNVEINKIVLSGNDDERLAGVGSVTCDSEGNVFFNGFTGSASERLISLNCGGIKLDEQYASQFIISLPPVIFSKGFTVTLNAKVDGADVTYTRSTDKPHTIRKSTFLSMPSFVFGEVPPEPVLNVSPSSLTFAAEGGEQKVTLSSNQDWTAESDSPWLSVTPSSGMSSEETVTITFKASANESSDARTAKVTFVAGDLTRSITVSQAGVGIPSALCVSKTELVFSSDGGEDSFELTSSVENWTSSKEADWLSVTPSSGVPSESPVAIKIKVNSNDGETTRTAIITFTAGDISKTVTVTQSGKVIPPSLEVNKTYFEVSAEGASLPLEVTSNVNWAASTDSDWVSISPSFGVASDKAVSVTLTVNANDALNERTATVTFTAGDLIKAVTVTQSGKVIPPSLEVNKTNFEVSAEGASLPLEVTSNVNWAASTDSDWVSISPSFGVASDKAVSVTLTVNANDALNERTATVTFTAGDISKTVTVTQSGKVIPPSLEVNKTNFEVSAEGASLPLEVTSNVNWTASTDSDWVSISPSFGVASDKAVSVTLTVNANDALNERTATVTFTAGDLIKAVTVTQSGKVIPPSLEISSAFETVGADGGTLSLRVQANYDWSVIVDDSWLSVSPSYGIGSSESVTVIVTVSSNESESSRTGQVVFASCGLSRTLTVEQEGFVPPSKEGDYIDEYGINHGPGVEIGGVVWAPVNCGYHAADFKYGKLYQWGRKYGQGYSGDFYEGDWHQTYSDSSVPEILSGPVSLSTGQSKANEDKFYYNSSSPYDWCSPQDDALWNSGSDSAPVKTEYDPCPDGWRVPTYAELSELSKNHSSWTTDDNGRSGRWFSGPNSYTASVPQVFFPAAGYRSFNRGSAYSRGSYGYYWSSRTDSDRAYYLYFDSGYADMRKNDRARGYSVRCVQDDATLIPVENITLSKSTLALSPGTSETLSSTITPSNANHRSAHWWSDNSEVAMVDQNGKVTAVSPGTATTIVYAMAGMQVATCEVTVVASLQKDDYIDEYGINHGQGVEIYGVVWAPVNCGYHAEDFKYGKLYQWGRKYGQGYSGDLYDVNGNKVGTYSDATVSTVVSGPVDLATGQSKDNENIFYNNSSDPWDWLSPQDDKLWNSGTEENPVKTEYDPCPEGWRVPTYAELNGLIRNCSSWTSEGGQPGYWFSGATSYTENVPQVFFPAAGYLGHSNGTAYRRGNNGYYWSSRTDGYRAYYLYFSSGYARMSDYLRALGYSVRCVQD